MILFILLNNYSCKDDKRTKRLMERRTESRECSFVAGSAHDEREKGERGGGDVSGDVVEHVTASAQQINRLSRRLHLSTPAALKFSRKFRTFLIERKLKFRHEN